MFYVLSVCLQMKVKSAVTNIVTTFLRFDISDNAAFRLNNGIPEQVPQLSQNFNKSVLLYNNI